MKFRPIQRINVKAVTANSVSSIYYANTHKTSKCKENKNSER